MDPAQGQSMGVGGQLGQPQVYNGPVIVPPAVNQGVGVGGQPGQAQVYNGPYIVPPAVNQGIGVGNPPGQPQVYNGPVVVGPAQPGPAGRGRGRGRGRGLGPRGGQQRQPRRARIPAVALTLNPMAVDFSTITQRQGFEQVQQWVRRYNLVNRRPQFQMISINTIIKAENKQPQILSVGFRGDFVLTGTWPMIVRNLDARIVEAVEQSFEADAAAQLGA